MNRTWFILILFLFLASELLGEFTWQEAPAMNFQRAGHAAAVVDGNIYVFGGIGSRHMTIMSSSEVYAPGDDEWSNLSATPLPLYQATAVAYGSKILIFGGRTDRQDQVNQIIMYDTAADSFSVAGRMMMAHLFGMSAVRVERRILIMGGSADDREYEAGGKWLSIDRMHWEDAPEMNNPRANFHLIKDNGTVYAVGGIFFTPQSHLEMLRNEQWIEREPMSFERGLFGAALFDGRLVVAGGNTRRGQTSLVEAYNPRSDSWEQMPRMPASRMDFTLVEADGKLYAIGGRSSGQDMRVTNQVWVFSEAVISVEDNYPLLPVRANLVRISPNPGNSMIRFNFPVDSGFLTLSGLDGRPVAEIEIPHNRQSWQWDSRQFPAGTYLYNYKLPEYGKALSGSIIIVK